jgi:hypothetical protein
VTYARILGIRAVASKMFRFAIATELKIGPCSPSPEPLNLRVGDWVEVRSLVEIRATLDADAKLRGLRFIPEMAEYCGGRYRVCKVLNKIVMESTGELRRMRSPTVLLEGVICDGRLHGGCDRSCFCFWREAWLRISHRRLVCLTRCGQEVQYDAN